jgi:acyl carrier protein
MDVLDIMFRLERVFDITIASGDLERHAARRTPPDVLVIDLIALVRSKRPAYPVRDGVLVGDVACVGCQYNLRGLEPFTNCPECGTEVAHEAQLRAGVTQVLVDALGINPDRVTDDASIFRDLGAG